jgi:hypothetical protein
MKNIALRFFQRCIFSSPYGMEDYNKKSKMGSLHSKSLENEQNFNQKTSKFLRQESSVLLLSST